MKFSTYQRQTNKDDQKIDSKLLQAGNDANDDGLLRIGFLGMLSSNARISAKESRSVENDQQCMSNI